MKLRKLSGRVPLSRKYAIEKKVRAHTRKMRKAARSNASLLRRRSADRKAALAIPNNYPFKAEILWNLQQRKERHQREKEDLRQRRKLLRQKAKADRKATSATSPEDEEMESGEHKDNSSAYEALLGNALSQQQSFQRTSASERECVVNGVATVFSTTVLKRPNSKCYLSVTTEGARPCRPESATSAFPKKKRNTSSDKMTVPHDETLPFPAGQDCEPLADLMNLPKRRQRGLSTTRYLRELYQLIEQADVVVAVLDARDPMGGRSERIENYILGKGKKLILLLNKIDLVPNEAVFAWLKYLRCRHPTIAFKSVCGTAERASQSHISALHAPMGLKRNHGQVLGATCLLQLIKNYARSFHLPSEQFAEEHSVESGDVVMQEEKEQRASSASVRPSGVGNGKTAKQSITVGIIGYPNVGKSSVINSLKRSPSSAATGAVCGVTKQLQYFLLDKQVKLIDSPGVIFAGGEEDPAAALRNTVNVNQLRDPERVVECLLQKCPKEQLRQLYKVDDFGDAEQFLRNLAQSRGKLAKGGVPNVLAAARIAITEWTSGKIPYYCMPPSLDANDEHASTQIVSHLSSTLDLEALWRQEDQHLSEAMYT